ncbi:transposase family protein [Candidatus Halobeggiatoa sp. HSG11]|nr:transposase family protein [Candidatus Halobeggiatoa sp. HSG11]
MNKTIPYSDEKIINFINVLGELTDPRDERGKRHSLPFVIASVILAILVGRSTVSSIFRYISNKIKWF